MNSENEKNERLQSFINKISAETNAEVTENGGSLEFKFSQSPKTSLVFEQTDDAEAPEPEVTEAEVITAQPPVNEEPAPAPAEEPAFDLFSIAEEAGVLKGGPAAESIPEAKSGAADGDGDEFIIPDVFDVAKTSGAGNEDYVSTIWKAYVPRFTDVTDKHNYFADNSAAKTQETAEIKAERVESESAVSASSHIKVERSNAGDYKRNLNDPTAEIETVIPDAVVINVGSSVENGDAVSVFKFYDKVELNKPKYSPSDEELQRRRITDLTGHKWETPEEAPEEKEPKAAETPAEANEPEIKIFTEEEPVTVEVPEQLPPEEAPVPAVQKKIVDADPIPEGIDVRPVKRLANDTTEYNSFSMRDSFKDRFLDSIMAVRIRLLVSIILGIAAFVFDIFERDICNYFGFGDSLYAPALIDCCLVASLFLITVPETVKSMRKLFAGIVAPELSAALSGIVIFVYGVVMSSIATDRYPLFASIYAIIAINSIFATYCLQSADFRAFRTVSEKGIRYIMDKPMTRSLEHENIALDGVVDEYKSKTARVFKTSFVSDFFANSRKTYDNTKNNLVTMAISFGVALVGGLVMFFVSDIEIALVTFTMVVALATPAFAALTRRMPFASLEKRAASVGNAVIGEQALYDYAGVDVVVFEDTEVFGPDDVTLKSASDRRSDYLDSMRKMASLFAALGGPLCRVFEGALNKKYPPAFDVVVEDDGAQGNVDGYIVMAGNAEYMRRHNIRIPTINDYSAGSTKIIYAASDGEFFATFTVNYSFSEEFALTLSAMREKGMVPLIHTRDFNINNEFMRFLTGGADIIRVMKRYSPFKEDKVYARISSPMVTTSDKSASIDLLLSAKKYTHFESFMGVLELSASGVGAALAVMIAISLYSSINMLPTALLAVWQIGWSAVLAFMTFRNFGSRRKKGRKDATE